MIPLATGKIDVRKTDKKPCQGCPDGFYPFSTFFLVLVKQAVCSSRQNNPAKNSMADK